MAHIVKRVAGKFVKGIAIGVGVLAAGTGVAASENKTDVEVLTKVTKNQEVSIDAGAGSSVASENVIASHNDLAFISTAKGVKEVAAALQTQTITASQERQQQMVTDLTKATLHTEEVRLEKEKAEKLAEKHLEEVRLHNEEVKEQAKWAAIAVSVLGVAAAGGLAAVKIWGK
jgi:hypothetical protein